MNIIINATALRSGGALTILKQFIEAIPSDDFTYIVFVDDSVQLKTQSNVILIPLNKRSFFKRIIWDAHGLKQWLKKRHITPTIAISLQNTNFRVNAPCPNYIYYHQSLPFYPYKWSFFKSNERNFWFYKNIYPLFVKLFINSRTEIFVQLHYIKEAFAKKYHVKTEKIHVVFPKIEVSEAQNTSIVIDKQKVNLFYPATAFFYKNHKLLFDAFVTIDVLLSRKIALYLTCQKDEIPVQYSYRNIEIIYLGQIPHSTVMWHLNEANGCVFPSYIETLGLPLVEAASFGLPVIASDLPYAREVLDGYEGVTFVNYQDAKAWGNEILKLCANSDKKYSPYLPKS